MVGMGNSAMDIAVESSYVAEKVFLAARRGAHVIPKYVFGRPIDEIATSPHIPFPVRRRIFEGLLRTYQWKMEQYALPKPDHRLGDAHPTISADLLSRVADGEVTPKPNRLNPHRRGRRRCRAWRPGCSASRRPYFRRGRPAPARR